MATSNPSVLVNGGLLRMHVGKKVRLVIQVLQSDGGNVIGKATDDQQVVIKGSPPFALSTFVEVIGIADGDKSVRAETWTNFGDTFEKHAVPKAEKKEHADLLALPPYGSEVYVGGLPHDISEEDLKRFCQVIGLVTEIRIMKGKDSGQAKGYAFVTFKTKELASKAIDELNNSEFKGKKIRCSTSQAKHKLFIGNIPKEWGDEEMRKAVEAVGPGVTRIELLKDPQNTRRNRGYVFIEYYNHACAEYSRLKMSIPEFKLADNSPTVSWADPKNADSSASSQVKALYVKNLPRDVTQESVMKLFERHGRITKVVLPPAKPGHENSRFGFIHYADRSGAMKALKNTEIYELDGQVVECSLAKPHDQKTSGAPNLQKPLFNPSFPPQLGYSMVGGAYGALGAGYGAAGFAQPLVYGRGAPAGMAMMPMLLPDGRIGYVLQQPGMQPHSGHSTPPQQHHRSGGGRGGGGSGSSSGGRRSNGGDSGSGSSRGGGRSRYNPY
ncbi:hypothetical protein ACFE04_001010 [Oxalis oulophora]